jgi:hypothetical protein
VELKSSPITSILFLIFLIIWSPCGFAGPDEDIKRVDELRAELVSMYGQNIKGLSSEELYRREELYREKFREIDDLIAKNPSLSTYHGHENITNFNFIPLLSFPEGPQNFDQALRYLTLSQSHAQLAVDYLVDQAMTSAGTLEVGTPADLRRLNASLDAIEQGVLLGNFLTNHSLASLLEFADLRSNISNAVDLNDIVNRALLKWLQTEPPLEQIWEVFTRQQDPIVQSQLRDKPAFLQITPGKSVFDFIVDRQIFSSLDEKIEFFKNSRSRHYVFSRKTAFEMVSQATSSQQRYYIFSRSDFKTKILLLENFFETEIFTNAVEPLNLLAMIDPFSASAQEVRDMKRELSGANRDAGEQLLLQNREILRWLGVKYFGKYKKLGATEEQIDNFKKLSGAQLLQRMASSLKLVQRPVGLGEAEVLASRAIVKSCRALFQY